MYLRYRIRGQQFLLFFKHSARQTSLAHSVFHTENQELSLTPLSQSFGKLALHAHTRVTKMKPSFQVKGSLVGEVCVSVQGLHGNLS